MGVLIVSTVVGCACPAAGPAVQARAGYEATRPSNTAMPGVRNFARVSDVLFRGEQPTPEGFVNLREKEKVRTVVNLRTFHGDRDALRGTGFRYAHIPAQAWNIGDDDVAQFLKVVTDPANQPVFVHCQQGADRTGLCVAVYRVMEQGWTADEAAAELSAFGHNEIWCNVRASLRSLDVEKMRRRVAELPPVKVEVIE